MAELEMVVDNFDTSLLFAIDVFYIFPLALCSTLACIWYIQFSLKVHFLVKKILLAQGISDLIGILLMIASFHLLPYVQSPKLCGLLHDAPGLLFLSLGFFSFMLAQVRYWIAKKTNEDGGANYAGINQLMNLAILLFVTVELAFLALTANHYHISAGNHFCSGCSGFFPLQMALLALVLSLLFGAIALDVAMVKLIHRYNRVQPVQLVPWGQADPMPSGSRGLQDELKDTVPVISTAINSCSVAFFAAAFIYVNFSGKLETHSQQVDGPFTINALRMVIHMPIVLMFTIKSQGKAKAAIRVTPPNQLQFHEEIPSVSKSVDFSR